MKAPVQKQLSINSQLINYYYSQDRTASDSLNYIFLHGWRSDGTIWLDLLKGLEVSQFHCLDLPGFGKSTSPRKAMSLSDYANVVDAFINKLDLKNIVLVGHSFGGRVAIKLASTKPPYLNKLVLVDSAGFSSPSFKKSLSKTVAKGAKPFFKPEFMQPLREKIYATMGAEDYVATPELKDTFVKIISEDLSTDMGSINTPTVLIWGEDDKETPVKTAHKMTSLINDSRLEIIAGAGHFSFLDKPQEFTKLFNSFVR